jgi:hypothetical protein
MTRLKFCLSWFSIFAVVLPALAASGHYAIRPERVAGAMAGMGMQVSASQLSMLTDAVASTADPQLKVQSVQRWPGDRVMVRMECANREECLPFFVSVRMGKSDNDQQAMANVAMTADMNNRRPVAMAVRAGAPATLYLDGEHIHIRVAVVCMQSGAIGQTIRAEGSDHQQAYTAQVVGNGVLKGRL